MRWRMKRKTNLLETLMGILPEWLTGKRQEYEKEIYKLYGKSENQNKLLIEAMKTENLKRYVYISMMLALLLLATVLEDITAKEGPVFVTSEGREYIERPLEEEGNTRAELIAEGKVGETVIKKPVLLNIKPKGINEKVRKTAEDNAMSEPTAEEIVAKNLNSVIYAINKDDVGKRVYLPKQIEGIQNITWNMKKSNPIPIIIFIGGILLAMSYFSRYSKLKGLQKSCNESIQERLPEFLNKLVLLMNAGLVLTSAFERAVSDYNYSCYDKKSYFYEQLTQINMRAMETNASIAEELKRFAERSGNREFMRIANVIWDNINKGTELVTVLQNESNFLWFQRKKQAEERGRIAETRLTLPLALQLVVLIMITLAPAILDM